MTLIQQWQYPNRLVSHVRYYRTEYLREQKAGDVIWYVESTMEPVRPALHGRLERTFQKTYNPEGLK